VADASLSDSIVAANAPVQCDGVSGSPQGNIVFPDATCPGTVADPGLVALSDNGGPTSTMRLPAGSPAIDAVPSVNAGCPSTDQRGIARPQGAACDAGAYERAAPGATTGPASADATTATLTATVDSMRQATAVHFEWSSGAQSGSTPDQTVAPGSGGASVTASLAALAPATTYHYRVVATNTDGTTAGQDATFTTAPSPPSDAATATQTTGAGAPPALRALALKPSAFRTATKRHRTHRGTVISYADSQAATTTFTVERRLSGVRRGSRCIAPPKTTKHGRKPARCTRYAAVRGSFTHHDKAGANSVAWVGALGGKPLAPGVYRLDAGPAAGGLSGATISHAFRILR
jgi:hypothetical protein